MKSVPSTRKVQTVNRRSRSSWLTGWSVAAVFALVASAGLMYLVVTGKTRFVSSAPVATSTLPLADSTTTTVELVPRLLDGVLVPSDQAALPVMGVMVENNIDARPLSGPAKANVVIEAPVEGGITRFLLLFDATTTAEEVGPVRSARPYFVDWAQAWQTAYFHVGGSPEALQRLRDLGKSFANVDEYFNGGYFWRAGTRYAPHNVYTKTDWMNEAALQKGAASSSPPAVWHFQDSVSSTARGGVSSVKITYGGVYNVTWKYDLERGVYVRSQASRIQTDRDGSPVESENVIVLKTDATVLDDVGRLRLRTTGSGEAIAYRDGNKYPIRWRRSQREPLRFETQDGAEFLLTRGRTWLEVTTDDRIFAGL